MFSYSSAIVKYAIQTFASFFFLLGLFIINIFVFLCAEYKRVALSSSSLHDFKILF